MSNSKRAIRQRRERVKARRAVELANIDNTILPQLSPFSIEPEERVANNCSWYWRNDDIPTDNLPDFIRNIMKRNHMVPVWNECYGNAVKLGFMLDDAGYDVLYCEAICEQGEYEKSMGRKGKGHPFSHAWLRVNGVDYNISSNGEPITIYRRYRMVVMPINEMRLANSWQGDAFIKDYGNHKPYLLDNLAYNNNQHPDVEYYVARTALPEMLTEYISTTEEFSARYDRYE